MGEFIAFPKIPRWNRDVAITEKIDGTQASLLIENGQVTLIGSRNRPITPDDDNFGFARWVRDNEAELVTLFGDHRVYGEWWGAGIQRGYGLKEKRFTPYHIRTEVGDTSERVLDCGVWSLPYLYEGPATDCPKDKLTWYDNWNNVEWAVRNLETFGSRAVPGYMNPEGVVVFHTASRTMYKVTCKDDDKHKGEV